MQKESNKTQIIQQSTQRQLEQQIKLRQLTILSLQQSNRTICLQHILKDKNNYIGNKKSIYYPYNYIYKDKGWGCAWRSIQIILSPYQIQNDFQYLFNKYSRKNKLLSIIKQHKIYNESTIQILSKSQFAPQNAMNNWAQPFIGHLVCLDNQIQCQLFLINGYPHANAPRQVFNKTYEFKQFVKLVQSNIQNSPIMIDDGTIAITILSYKYNNNNLHVFIIGDPHILSNKYNQKVGIYQITFDNQGNQISHNVTEQTRKQAYLDSISMTHFNTKKWMALITHQKYAQINHQKYVH